MTAQTQSLKGLDLLAEIERLKQERNAVILAHYYQKPEIQDLADFVGDSLDLSRKAAATDADVIAFCGVRFMAETAKILSPEKIVILPDMDAGCSLEDSCPPDQFKAFREAHPDHIALTYINCSAAVKALSRHHRHQLVGATSSSKQIPKDQKIIFGPDRHLGGYLARKTGRDMLLWPGICIVHQAFSETELLKLKAEHPGAPVAAHPECPPHIIEHSDHVGSTKSILDFAIHSPGADDPRRDRAAHHPPDGEGRAGQDVHRRPRRRRQLQLQHVPVHGAQHAREALRRAARPRAADRAVGRGDGQGAGAARADAGNGRPHGRAGRRRKADHRSPGSAADDQRGSQAERGR